MNQYQVLQFPAYPIAGNGKDEQLSVQINQWLTEHQGWHIYGLWNLDIIDEDLKIRPLVLIQFRKEGCDL